MDLPPGPTSIRSSKVTLCRPKLLALLVTPVSPFDLIYLFHTLQRISFCFCVFFFSLGDLGNVAADANGNVRALLTIQLSTAIQSYVGRSVILHSGADGGSAAGPTGGAGTRLAQGVLGLTSSFEAPVISAAPSSSSPAALLLTVLVSLLSVLLANLL
jgi:hypothetical protein